MPGRPGEPPHLAAPPGRSSPQWLPGRLAYRPGCQGRGDSLDHYPAAVALAPFPGSQDTVTAPQRYNIGHGGAGGAKVER